MNIAFARSSTGLAVRAGAPKPDISSPEKLKNVLLAAGAVSYSAGASGMHFVKIIERLGIAGEVAAKRVPPRGLATTGMGCVHCRRRWPMQNRLPSVGGDIHFLSRRKPLHGFVFQIFVEHLG